MSKERPIRVFNGNQLFLHGREVKATVLRTHPSRLTLILGGSRTGQVQLKLGEDLILTRSLGQICPWTTQNSSQSWVWLHENTRQYRGAKEGNVNA